MILGIVAGSVAFLVIVGLIIGTLANNNASGVASAPISPGTGTPTAHLPQPPPGRSTGHQPASAGPTSASTGSAGGPGTGGTSGTISFGGCKLQPANGWSEKTVKASEGLASVADSSGDVFQAQCVKLSKGTDPKQVLSSWFDQLSKNCTDSKSQPAASVDTGAGNLTAAQAQMQCSTSGSQGSTVMGIASAAAVRDDGMTAVTTLIYGQSSNGNQIGNDYSKMTVSVWSSLA